MSVGTLYYIECDDCGAYTDESVSQAGARARARREGYERIGGLDLCFRCKTNPSLAARAAMTEHGRAKLEGRS